ncbi:prolyl oligopeptidase family serine peptidase [Sporosarcina sp. 6E9]|uniref:prolyl oligopeptidase family serine peptidase n=1 Tax=Sporosarcina sp. 6E9 TaxID=2819235 RepID=UPI0034CFCAB1
MNEETWGTIPLLHIVENENEQKEVPVVVFFHGFTSAKEHNLHYAYNLAKKGMRVLLPDAHLHGVREENLDEAELSLRFWEIVITSIEELGIVRNELTSRNLLSSAKIGVAGTSMGGITTLGALKMYEWIDAAAVMMGAAGFVELAKAQIKQFESEGFKLPVTKNEREKLFTDLAVFDITKNQSVLNQRPLFFWHGKNDPVVPYKPTYKFYQAVKADYAAVPDRLSFVTDKYASHAVTRSGMLASVNWLASHLNE